MTTIKRHIQSYHGDQFGRSQVHFQFSVRFLSGAVCDVD